VTRRCALAACDSVLRRAARSARVSHVLHDAAGLARASRAAIRVRLRVPDAVAARTHTSAVARVTRNGGPRHRRPMPILPPRAATLCQSMRGRQALRLSGDARGIGERWPVRAGACVAPSVTGGAAESGRVCPPPAAPGPVGGSVATREACSRRPTLHERSQPVCERNARSRTPALLDRLQAG
jgi:hypothetical protein